MADVRLMAGSEPFFSKVEGLFYRAVDPAYRLDALSGSRSAGRYSSAAQPTLYLSASPEGVDAAMQAHRAHRSAQLDILRVGVAADRICDLRNAAALAAVGIDLEDAFAAWQDVVAEGGSPRSWRVRQRLESLGAHGLIDPSRQAPGLWHLVLFAWNHGDSPRVVLLDR